MKVVIYTQNNCQFTPQEKNYLASKGVTFEERNVETNKGYLDEMMKLGSNFAGTPVTQIVKDDGTSTVLKGFTQTEFDAALGGAPVSAANADMTMPQAPVDQPVVPPAPEPTPAPMPEPAPAPMPEPTPAPVVETPAPVEPAVQTANNPLDAILADLQQKVSAATPAVQTANADMTMPQAPVDQPVVPPAPEPTPAPMPEPAPAPAVDMPTPAADLPNVPDFPAK